MLLLWLCLVSFIDFVFPWYYTEFSVGANLPENIFQCTLHPLARGLHHDLHLREEVCLVIHLLLHACWPRHRDILSCSDSASVWEVLCLCVSGRGVFSVLIPSPSVTPLTLGRGIVPFSFSQSQWVFTSAPSEVHLLPFPSPVKAFVAEGDGGTSGLCPSCSVCSSFTSAPRVTLPGTSQSCW